MKTKLGVSVGLAAAAFSSGGAGKLHCDFTCCRLYFSDGRGCLVEEIRSEGFSNDAML